MFGLGFNLLKKHEPSICFTIKSGEKDLLVSKSKEDRIKNMTYWPVVFTGIIQSEHLLRRYLYLIENYT